MTTRIKPGEDLQTFSAGVYKVRPNDEKEFEVYCSENGIKIEKKTKITSNLYIYRVNITDFEIYKKIKETFEHIEKTSYATLDTLDGHEKPVQFAWRKNNVCIRACPEHLVYFEDTERIPIDFIKFDKNGEREYIRNIGYFYFDLSECCWEIKFLGNYFKDVQKKHTEDFWEMLGKAYNALTEWRQ